MTPASAVAELGCSLTLVVCLSPADAHVSETQSTLLFAARARGVGRRPGAQTLVSLGRELGLGPEAMARLGLGGEQEARALVSRLQRRVDAERDRRRQAEGLLAEEREGWDGEREGLERELEAARADAADARALIQDYRTT